MLCANLMNFLLTVDGTLSGSINDFMEGVEDVVQIVLNVIYVVLGLFLIVKGAILGLQIVKAADEPQVRQEKISSLKWLVIGVLIAYVVVIAANVLTSTLSGFSFTGSKGN